jgi:hypothetical protein
MVVVTLILHPARAGLFKKKQQLIYLTLEPGRSDAATPGARLVF